MVLYYVKTCGGDPLGKKLKTEHPQEGLILIWKLG